MTEPVLPLGETFASRRYFRKFEAISGHLGRVAAVMHAGGTASRDEVAALAGYLAGLNYTFRALSMKYLMVGRDTGRFFGQLTLDREGSGLPVQTELLMMANDAQQVETHLAGMPDARSLKEEMLGQIIGDGDIPTRLQFALSQRLYYEELQRGRLFWPRNDPQLRWQRNVSDHRRRFLIHWAVYDSETNMPVIYLMDLEDTGRTALPKDQRRWPEVQAHLMAQSVAALKPVTIATGFDTDFADLHPMRLRRIHIGPLYSSAFTAQPGPLMDVLREAAAPEGQDWALAWTVEEIEASGSTRERAGWFSTVERQTYALDPYSGRGVDFGATRVERAVILPQRPYQVLADRNPPGFSSVETYVVSPSGRVMNP